MPVKFKGLIKIRKVLYWILISQFMCCCTSKDIFPDGTEIPSWFFNNQKVDISELGKQYIITDFGAIKDDSTINTKIIQNIIDKAAETGGVIVIPEGTFLSGALFFKPGTHLHIREGGILKGSDNIENYPKIPSRMEGQNIEYYPALINAYGVNGFTISGKGTIDGNGLKYWKAFWARRKENPKCTNLEVSRPRLVFIWESDNVQIRDIKLHNSGFWTTHFYKCNNVKVLDAHIYAPKEPVPAPSSDAIDIDVCNNVLIKGCFLSVNDDAIALKGGKGPWADQDTNNGPNFNVLIENCHFGWCHSVLTCGSESIHNRNVLLRNCIVDEASRLLFLKMRPDTPQKYEYLTIENVTGYVRTCVFVNPWIQFFDLKGRQTPPVSSAENFTFKNITMNCKIFGNVTKSEHDMLKNFHFENLNITMERNLFETSLFNGITFNNVFLNGKEFK